MVVYFGGCFAKYFGFLERDGGFETTLGSFAALGLLTLLKNVQVFGEIIATSLEGMLSSF